MTKFNCIKCGVSYEESSDEAYLCEGCDDARKSLARQIDAKVGSTVGQQPKSEYQLLEKMGSIGSGNEKIILRGKW